MRCVEVGGGGYGITDLLPGFLSEHGRSGGSERRCGCGQGRDPELCLRDHQDLGGDQDFCAGGVCIQNRHGDHPAGFSGQYHPEQF